MDIIASSKVENAPFGHVASAFVPVDDRTVDDAVPEEHEDEHRMKLHAIGERGRCDGSSENGESQLVHDENSLGDRADHGCWEQPLVNALRVVVAIALEPKFLITADVLVVGAVAEGKGVAKHHPGDGDEGRNREGLGCG